ncbi:substrate-binding periplasmic protein [Thalassotalea atypica]|uniref:substrate-binding periplasmic protein n=1 Tax=Thalassotalea atypica TaxID=2054316 RepID=UPI0025728D09|nr:transporter substrate-binding domain-containing protein [Thalassotalea atypica]
MTLLSHAASPKSITLATTTWCPYTCGENKDDIGIIGSYIKEVFATLGIELHIETYPWSRAIHMAEQQQVDGLLTAAPQEAPNLLLSRVPISTYQMCFYTQKGNEWQYSTPLNISANRLAIIQDYGYGEPVDSYVKNVSGLTLLSGDNSTKRLLDLLLKSRVDIIIEDPMVLNWNAQISQRDTQKLNQAGCLSENPFYLALTPTNKHSNLIIKIDNALKLPASQALLKKLFLQQNSRKQY